MVKIIGNVLAIRWTAGVVEHLRPSFSALLDAEDLGGAARVRDSALGGAASPAEAIQSHCARHGRRVRTDSAAPPPPAAASLVLVAACAGPTWDRCVPALLVWGHPVRRYSDCNRRFWVQVRPRRRRQASGPTEPGSGAAPLVDPVRCAMERLLAAAPKVPAAIASGFTAAGKARHPPGPAAVEIWPVEVQALAHRLSGVGIPAHRLPIFGPWLFKDVTPSLQLAGVLSTRAFRALATRSIRTVGGDASNCGTHSLRRAAAALFHAGVPHPLITQALRPPRHGRTSHRHVSFITIGKKAGFLRGGSDHGRIQNFRRTSGNIFFDHFWTSHTPLNQLSVPRWPPHRACRAAHAAARRARWCCHYACGSGPTEYPPTREAAGATPCPRPH